MIGYYEVHFLIAAFWIWAGFGVSFLIKELKK